MFTEIGEPVSVEVFFSSAGVMPRWFLWRGRKIPVREITQRWEERRGEAKFRHFAVHDGADVFDIVLDVSAMRWELAGVSGEG